MSLDIDDRLFALELAHEIERTERYLSDLRRLQAGQYPSEAELGAATAIRDGWQGLRQTGCIVGIWPGFDRVSMSSRLCVLAAKDGWARTTTHLYRLENWQGRSPPVGAELGSDF